MFVLYDIKGEIHCPKDTTRSARQRQFIIEKLSKEGFAGAHALAYSV